MTSPYRDRTAEFRSLLQTLQKIGGISSVNDSHLQNDHVSKPPPPLSSRSEFNKKASLIGSGIHETSQKIVRLAKLAKRSSMFDDPIMEIQELTALIKSDITALNMALSDLQTLQNMEIADGNYSEDRVVHSTTVCDDLKGKLMGATKHLQDVLTARTENIKAHENRKQIFSKNASRENPFQRQTESVTEPPPWSSSSTASGSLPQSGLPPNGVQAGSQLRRRPAVDGTPSHHMEMSMLQQVVPRQEHYSQSRAVALQNVESTISELSGIFTHLATMVAQQGELAIRIDEDMDQSLANVEGARNALLRHLNQISSNRWLLIKIFIAIVFFLVVFIIFVA
ncbi:PREDICTED: syntaxin-31 [Theobroma cacao]|uniref:Syntaxin-31 n=2 Tax=Theobroma cacao TaxID=3641 RepID=A0AB32X3A4_THECC|nr:PREDICTED: syntaxin-31 [Theobroma cacao]EOY17859.1 Syntaxin of plants 31 isoform 1 [Theobroma cacao]